MCFDCYFLFPSFMLMWIKGWRVYYLKRNPLGDQVSLQCLLIIISSSFPPPVPLASLTSSDSSLAVNKSRRSLEDLLEEKRRLGRPQWLHSIMH